MRFTEWGPAFGPDPNQDNLEAAAAAKAEPLPGVFAATPFFQTASNGVAAGRIPSDWLQEGGVSWRPTSCHTADCEQVECEDCDPEATLPTPDELTGGLTNAQFNTDKRDCAYPFKVSKDISYNDCAPSIGMARSIVEANVPKMFGRQLHARLADSAKPLNDSNCTCMHTAIGMLVQAREANHDGSAWFTLPRLLLPAAIESGLATRVGNRWQLMGHPLLTGGVPITGPGGVSGEGCAWVWAHGPVDYALSAYEDRSYWNEITNSGLDSGRQYGLVRVDSCGAYGVPVTTKCGCA